MRLFYAATVPDTVRDALQRTLSQLGRLPFRWLEPGLWHFTLKFLGECDPPQSDALLAADPFAATPVAPFVVALAPTLAGLPEFGPRMRIVHAELASGAAGMADLAARLSALAERHGIPPEDRPFRAHLTLARIKQGPVPSADLTKLRSVRLPAAALAGFTTDRVELIESQLGPRGPTYHLRRTWPLTPGTPSTSPAPSRPASA